MQLCFERAISEAIARRQRFVEDGDGAVEIAGLGLGLGDFNLEQPIEKHTLLFAQEIDAATHVLEPGTLVAALRFRPTFEKYAKRAPQL